MYHDVVAPNVQLAGSMEHFSVPVTAFEAQLDHIASLGYRGCSIEEALVSNEPRVAVSFDDGDMGQFANAFPALARRGMSATFFVTTGWVGRPGYASWDALKEMKTAGMSIQSHTRSHPYLSELTRQQLTEELRGSREDLDQHLEQKTTALALPGGEPPRAAWSDALAEAGYRVIATSRWGVNRHTSNGEITWIRRCTVAGAMTPAEFQRILEGDARLSWRRSVRDGVLRILRTSIGPSRYLRWRHALLDALAGRRGTDFVEGAGRER
jgi:peptidoglycan/xylan/chitin deacetylase (PgdA/CDA1 family)